MSNRRNNKVTKNLKDYAVPLVGLVIILIITFNVFSGSSTDSKSSEKVINNENTSGLSLSLEEGSEAEIVNSLGGTKKVDESSNNLSKGDKLRVISGSVSIDFPSYGKLNLDKNGELDYNQNGEISLNSSYLWVNSSNKFKVKMKYASISIGENSVVSLDQNEVGSTLYLLDGTVEVANLVGKSVTLEKGEKITIGENIASSNDVDLLFEKEPINDYFKGTQWYAENNGDLYLNSSGSISDLTSGELSGSGEESTKANSSGEELIVIDNPTLDEAFSETPTIDIEGSILDENIAEITVNGINAKINKETNKFSIKNFSLEKKTNDLVYKVFDENKDVLGKYVKTIYYQGGKDDETSTTGFNVENFDIDASEFKFTSPTSEGIYTTYDDEVSIYGETPPSIIKKVTVNGYRLKTFNGTTWRYHAKKVYENMKEGTNVYEIKYYGDADKLIYKNTFTIIKKTLENKS